MLYPVSLSRPTGDFQMIFPQSAQVSTEQHGKGVSDPEYQILSQESSPRTAALAACTLPSLLCTQGSLLAITPAYTAQPPALYPLPTACLPVPVRAPRKPKHLRVENALESMKSIGNLMRLE